MPGSAYLSHFEIDARDHAPTGICHVLWTGNKLRCRIYQILIRRIGDEKVVNVIEPMTVPFHLVYQMVEQGVYIAVVGNHDTRNADTFVRERFADDATECIGWIDCRRGYFGG